MIQPSFTTGLMTCLGGGHAASAARRSAAVGAIRVTAIARGADRKQAAAVPAGSLTKRCVHGAANDRRCHWTPVPFRGTNRTAAFVAWSTRRSRGPGGSVRVPTSSRSPQRTSAARRRSISSLVLVEGTARFKGGASASARPRRCHSEDEERHHRGRRAPSRFPRFYTITNSLTPVLRWKVAHLHRVAEDTTAITRPPPEFVVAEPGRGLL